MTLTAGAPHVGKVIRAEVEESTLYAAIDRVADVVSRQLRKLKERDLKGGTHTHHKLPSKISELMPSVEATEGVDEADAIGETERLEQQLPPAVLRRKQFAIETISASEAVEKLEDVGHDFYVYRDALTGSVQVLYRRKRGGYGVLVPK